jgi:hypothetical protein
MEKNMLFFIPRNFFDRSNWMPIESEDENLNGVCEEAALQVTTLSIGTGASASITSNDETVMMSLNTIDKYYSSSRVVRNQSANSFNMTHESDMIKKVSVEI